MRKGLKKIMSAQQHRLFWIATAIGSGILFYLLADVVAPFLAGMALAYILSPAVDVLARWSVPRIVGAVLMLAASLGLVLGVFLLLLPVLLAQVSAVVEKLPDYIEHLRMILMPLLSSLPFDLELAAPEVFKGSEAIAPGLLASLWSGGEAFISILSFLVITPIIGLYMLRDWPKIIARVDDLMPRKRVKELRAIAKEIDEALSASLRGQLSVCLALAVFYAVALQLLGLDFGLLIGIFSGLISFIPYAGAVFGFLLAMQAGLLQFWPDWLWALGLCAGVFLAGQIIEGYWLTPQWVGKKVGLHAVWIIFALLAFGALWGFAGLLLALPASAAIGVLIRHGLGLYQHSAFYKK